MPDNVKLEILYFIIVFALIFVVDYLFILRKKVSDYYNNKKNKNFKNSDLGELGYLISRFNLDKSKLNLNISAIIVAFINALIIAGVVTVIGLIESNLFIRLLIGFVLLFALIYALYEIYGRFLRRKAGKKDV